MPLAIISMWMHHSRLRKLVIDWFRFSQGQAISEFDVFDKFALLWISFNAWGKYKSKKESDRKMLNWSKKNSVLNTKFAELLNIDHDFIKDVTTLQGLCPIRRNKKYNNSYEANITNINNFDEVLEVIYAIRCNFFHGQQSPDDRRDQTLIELAFRIFKGVFRKNQRPILWLVITP